MLGIICCNNISAQSAAAPDSTQHRLKEVVVEERRKLPPVIPVQTLSGRELQRLSSNSIADALRYFAGVQVKDYGGVGGIKTVNIRSMGTNHTSIVYDGIELGNAQNGQIDLGQFSLDNIESLSLFNGQKSEILQPAKDFGSAGTVYIHTRTPSFSSGSQYHLRGTLRTGSFDLINPSALVELRLRERVTASLSAEWLNSSGKYKFRYRRVNPAGELAYDTTAIRQNGDINATRLELNLNGSLTDATWSIKLYNYNSERGVPGAIVNNVWRRGERIWDTNSFAQGRYTMHRGRLTTLNNVKYSSYRTHYVNNDDKQVKIDNLYRQKEFYISTANEYMLRRNWRIAASADLMYNTLQADMYGFVQPERLSSFLALASALNLRHFKAQGSVQHTYVHDILRGQQAPDDQSVITPALFVAYTLRHPELSVRAFCKQSFRMPTFNDLYYADMGNSKLSPERVTQYNLGLIYEHRHLRFSLDAYYNLVKDKIVAYPKGQQFRWTMLNLGRVDIRGIDASALFTLRPTRHILATLRCQYTLQRAIDITNPADNYYRHQIPYIPRHSGSLVANVAWRSWTANYSWIYAGARYNQQENIRYNYTQPWYTSDVSISKEFKISGVAMRCLAEINNLLSQDYDVILNYPMPKRNYRFTLSVEI